MDAKFYDKGFMDEIDSGRYIIINPADFEETIDLLNRCINATYKPIDYNVYYIRIGKQVAIALSSADPRFYFGKGESDFLRYAGIYHFIGSAEEGQFANVRSIDEVRQNAEYLGLDGVSKQQPPIIAFTPAAG